MVTCSCGCDKIRKFLFPNILVVLEWIWFLKKWYQIHSSAAHSFQISTSIFLPRSSKVIQKSFNSILEQNISKLTNPSNLHYFRVLGMGSPPISIQDKRRRKITPSSLSSLLPPPSSILIGRKTRNGEEKSSLAPCRLNNSISTLYRHDDVTAPPPAGTTSSPSWLRIDTESKLISRSN